jgi:predicted MFS family arabinose efflux permease
VLAFAAALMLRPGEPHKPRADGSKPVPVREILNMPGIRAIFFVSIVTVAAQDLIVVYLPVLGRERGMSVNDVGTLLAVRAAASMLSRFVYSRLNTLMGRPRLMLISTLASAATYTGLAIPLPLWAMNVVIASAGFALGVAVTVSIASLLAMSSADLRGTANSLRMMGNRMGQFTIPFIAGLVAAASGAASIFFALGLSLAVAGAVVRVRRPGA